MKTFRIEKSKILNIIEDALRINIDGDIRRITPQDLSFPFSFFNEDTNEIENTYAWIEICVSKPYANREKREKEWKNLFEKQEKHDAIPKDRERQRQLAKKIKKTS